MNELSWIIETKEQQREVAKTIPSSTELRNFSMAYFAYFCLLQLLVLKFTPFCIVPALLVLISVKRLTSPVIPRMHQKLLGMQQALNALTNPEGQTSAENGSPMIIKKQGRVLVSNKPQQQEVEEEEGWEGMADKGHGKENQWGDVVLEDDQNQQQ